MKFIKLSSEEKKRRSEQRKKERYNKTHKTINNIIYKKCSRHKTYFPDEDPWLPCTEEYFHKNKSNGIDGLNPYCKKCNIQKSGKWQKDNARKHNANNRHYYAENKWDVKGIMRQNAVNRRLNGKYYQWTKTESGQKSKNKSAQKRMKKQHEISKEEWENCKRYFNYQCAYCGMTDNEHKKLYKRQLNKDHADPNGANDLSNCIPSCGICNSAKHNKDVDEWYNLQNPIYNKSRLDKIHKWLNSDYKTYIENKKLNENAS